AAVVDVAAVAGRGGRQGPTPVGEQQGVPVVDVEHVDAADAGADRAVAEGRDADRYTGLAGRLVGGDAEDAELAAGAGCQEGVGRRVHAVVDVHDEARPGVGLGLVAAGAERAQVADAVGRLVVDELDVDRLARVGDDVAVGQDGARQGALNG